MRHLPLACRVLMIGLGIALILAGPQFQPSLSTLAAEDTSARTPITADNVLHMVHLNTLGSGVALDMKLFPKTERIGVLSSRGLWLYDLTQPDLLPHLYPAIEPNVNVSPDGKYFSVFDGLQNGSQPNNIIVYATQSGQSLREIPSPHVQDAPPVAFSPDSKLLAISAGPKLYFMDMTTLALSNPIPLTQPAWDITFTHDGQRLLVGEETSVQVLNVATRQFLPERAMRIVDKGLIAFDGQTLAVIAGPLWYKPDIWRRYNGSLTFDNILAISADRSLAVVTSPQAAGDLLIWDVLKGQAQAVLSSGDTDKITSVAFSPAANLIVTASESGSISLWDAQTGQTLATYQDSLSIPLTHIGFDGLGKRIAATNNQGELWIWNITNDVAHKVSGLTDGHVLTQDYALSRVGYEGAFGDLAFNADGSLLAGTAWMSSGHDLYVWKVDSGQFFPLQHNLGNGAFSVSFSPDGKLLAEGSKDGVHLWDVVSGKSLSLLDDATIGASSEYPFSPDGKLLATAGPDRTTSTENPEIGLWDVASGKRVSSLPLQGAVAKLPLYTTITSLAFSPDGKMLASALGSSVEGPKDTPVFLWNISDIASARPIKTLNGPHSDNMRIAFSPDGKLLAGASIDVHTIWLWDLTADGSEPFQTLQAKCNGGSISFSHDASLLISAGSEVCSLELWDVKSGKEISGFPPLYGVTQVTFNPDGTLLALGMGDLTVQLWGIPSSPK